MPSRGDTVPSVSSSQAEHMTVRKALYLLSLTVFLTSFGPPLLTASVARSHPAGLSLGEAVDLSTPFLVIGGIVLLWALIRRTQLGADLEHSDWLAFGSAAFSAVLMTGGHGIHLSSNSLSHFLNLQEHGDIFLLNHLYDEVISHYMWHVGAFGLSASVALYQLKYPLGSGRVTTTSLLAASALYAGTFTFATIEGDTVPAVLPLTLLVSALFLVIVRRHELPLQHRPVVLFFLLCSGLMLLGWLAYAVAFGGFVPPTELLGRR